MTDPEQLTLKEQMQFCEDMQSRMKSRKTRWQLEYSHKLHIFFIYSPQAPYSEYL